MAELTRKGPSRRAICMLIIVVAVFYGSTAKTIQRGTKAPCTKNAHKQRKPAQIISAATPFPQFFSARITTKPPHKHRKTKTPCTRRHPQNLKKTTPQRAYTESTPLRPTTQESRPPTRKPKTKATTTTAACKPLECVLGEWNDWTSCSSSCGNTGMKQRHRKIVTDSLCGGVCPRPLQETKPCHRFCMNGGSLLQRGCKCLAGYDGVCCEKVNGNWSPWGQWSQCSTSCDSGIQKRMRSCDKPPPSNAGMDCAGPMVEMLECNTQKCPVNGGWNKWGNWSPCSSTCGEGHKFRLRQCNNPFPSNGGQPCIGLMMLTAKCQLKACKIPVDGGWSTWLEWSQCSKSCGKGMRVRTRLCNNPLPSDGGRACTGSSQEEEGCNKGSCQIGNGGSGAEGGIGKRNGHATSSRHDKRHTINIRHDRRRLLSYVSSDIITNFDAIVQSHSEELLQRDDRTNIVGPWTSWSSCSTTCGTGQRFRSRACNDLANPCIGVPMEVQPCNMGNCTP